MTESLRTKIYIDGFNFFYGCLKGTPYKWLDLHKLFINNIIPSVQIDPKKNVQPEWHLVEKGVCLYTADIIESISDVESVKAQKTYHNALKKLYPNTVNIIKGYYSKTRAKAYLVEEGKQPLDSEQVTIWKLEEKKSDVNLAIDAYHDVATDSVDMVVIVTNDTDVERCLEKIKELNRDTIIGLVSPNENINPNQSLKEHADWVYKRITRQSLQEYQLPNIVVGGRRPSRKPVMWYETPKLVEKVLELGKQVLKTEGKVWKYLNTPNSKYFNGSAPIDLLNTEAGCQEIISYMEKYIDEN